MEAMMVQTGFSVNFVDYMKMAPADRKVGMDRLMEHTTKERALAQMKNLAPLLRQSSESFNGAVTVEQMRVMADLGLVHTNNLRLASWIFYDDQRQWLETFLAAERARSPRSEPGLFVVPGELVEELRQASAGCDNCREWRTVYTEKVVCGRCRMRRAEAIRAVLAAAKPLDQS